MDAAFEHAVDIVARLSKSGPVQTSYDEKLLLYALFKQATEGPPRTARPGVLDLLGRAKYDAWKRREGLSAHEAKRGYVEALKKILRSYGDKEEAVDYARELEQLLNQGDPRDLVISGSIADSDISSDEEERRSYQPPPPAPRVRQSTQTSSQASSSRGYVSAATGTRSQSSKSLAQKQRTQPRQQTVREDDDTASSVSDPISPPVATSRDRLPPQRQAPPVQARYAPSASGSTYTSHRPPISTYNPSNAPPLQHTYSYGRPPSGGPMPRSPLAQPPITTPGPDIEGLRQKLSALEAFLTQPDVPEERKRQVEIEIAKTRGYLAVISQRFNAMTPTSGITLSELQQQTIQRMQPSTPGALSHVPASNLERALDNIQTSLTALNERLSRLEARPPTPVPPARLPIIELLNRLLFFLHLRETPRGLQRWSWINFLTTLRGAVTDFAFIAFLVGLAFSVRRHGLGYRAFKETWMRVLLLGATNEIAGRVRPLEA